MNIPQFYIAFVVLNLCVILLFQPFLVSGDAFQYIETARFLFGEEGGVLHPARILKPLGPFFASVLGGAAGDEWLGLLFQNGIFYVATSLLIFLFLRRLFGNDHKASLGSVLYLSSYPLLQHGITYMTDFSGWFFSLLTFYLTLCFFDKPGNGAALGAGLAAGIGFLFKEYAVAGALFFFLVLVFMKNESWSRRFQYGTFFLLSFLAVAGIWQVWSLFAYNAWYGDWYPAGGVGRYSLGDIPFIVKSLAATFLFGWVFVLWGWWIGMKRHVPAREHMLLKLMLIPSCSFLLWHVASSRIYFVAGPLGAALSALALYHLFIRSKVLYWASLVLIVGFNYGWFLYGEQIRPLLWPWIQS